MTDLLDKILSRRQKRKEIEDIRKEAGFLTAYDFKNKIISDIGSYLSTPFRKGPMAGIELAARGKNLTENQRTTLNKLQQLFGSQEEQKQISGDVQKDPAKALSKIGAGQMAYFVPGGSGAKGIIPFLSRILSSTGAGALAGYGVSEEGKELQQTKTGAFTGALISTGFEALGALKGIFPKVEKGGREIVRKSQAKIFGKPKQKYGGMKLFDNMDNVGIRSNNIENIADDSLKILNTEGGKLKSQIGDMASQGVRVNVQDVIGGLETKIANTKSSAARKPLENVLKELKADFGNQSSMLIDDFYSLKQNYGGLGKWTPGSGADKTIADVYEDVYMSMNDVLNNAFETVGKIPLKELNKKISTAINALDFVNTQAANKLGSAPLALDEIIAGTGGFIAGGPAGAGVGALGIKAATSPKVQMAGGQALQKIGSLGGGGQIIPQALQKILSIATAGKSPQITEQEKIMESPINNIQSQQNITDQIVPPSTSSRSQIDRSTLSPEKQRALDMIDQAEAQAKGGVGGMGATGGAGQIGQITPQQAMMAQMLLSPKELTKFNNMYNIQQQEQERVTKLEASKKPKAMTEKQKAYDSASIGAKSALDLLTKKGSKVKTGIGEGIKAQIGEKTGQISDEQVEYRSKVAGVRTLLKNAVLGANMSKQEMESLAPFIPEYNDAPNVAKQKLKTFIEMTKLFASGEMQSSLTEELQALQQQGINL